MDNRWQQVERIYHAAREIKGTARAEFLAKACAGDGDLRREVEALLVQADESASFLQSPAIEMAAGNWGKDESVSDPSKPTLEVGTMVAHYRLTGKLGAGGMGEVYRARDTKLDRDVAIKVLAESMARDAQRMARFEREAQVLASLNHPNIAAIYGIEESKGTRALVMELVEGETLAEKLVGEGPALQREPKGLPYPDALPIARQIAEGLEYAHERGVIHRDLKPANVKITPEGTVKVLDFGLAKILTPQDSTGTKDAADSPTLSAMTTRPGMILGTAAYMSPEQAKGKQVDRRCDIWAFGCVLFEMLSGKKAFEGETISDVLVAVLTKEPDWTTLPETTPPPIQKLTRRCLQKDQHQRLQAIGDARITIEETLSGNVEAGLVSVPAESTPARPRRSPQRRTLPWALAAIVVVAALAYGLFNFLRTPPAPIVTGVHQITNTGRPKDGNLFTDGKRIYFTERAGSRDVPMVVPANGGEAVPIPLPAGIKGGWVLGVSPDGNQLLIIDSKGRLWRVPVLGGSAQPVGDFAVEDAADSPDGRSLFYIANGLNLYLTNADGSGSRKLFTVPQASHLWHLVLSPDGRRLSFNVWDNTENRAHIYEASVNGSNLHRFLPGWNPGGIEVDGTWTPDGKYFVFQATVSGSSNLWTLREGGLFGANRKPVELTTGPMRYSLPRVSKDGKRVFALGTPATPQLSVYDSRLKEFVPYLGGIAAESVSFSRDGNWVAYVRLPEGTLWRMKMDGSDKLQLTFSPMKAFLPRWSPDGKQIVFTDVTQGKIDIISADGGSPEAIMSGKPQATDPNWSPDEKSVMFSLSGTNPNSSIDILDLKTHKTTEVPGSRGLFSARWSPDGRYVAALTTGAHNRPVLFAFKTRKWEKISDYDVGYPTWSSNGKYLYFISGATGDSSSQVCYRFDVANGKVEQVANLGNADAVNGVEGAWYGMTPDGKPLVARQVGTSEIYALDVRFP